MRNYFYTEPGCAVCIDAKRFLISHGIPFEERDIRTNPDYLRILTEELDSRVTPTLVIAGKIIVGFDQAEYELLARDPVTNKKINVRSRT
jgi:glutaredoxin